MSDCITSEECQTIKNVLDQSVSLLVINNEGKITYVNECFCEFSTYQTDELLMKDHTILSSGYTAEEDFTKIKQMIKTREKWIGTCALEVNVEKKVIKVKVQTLKCNPYEKGAHNDLNDAPASLIATKKVPQG